ncbi:4Fe-4S binding protein [Bacillota bacterium LX-D]|nr:4Fe-4S binding protein [Bacillota bacterium LX-D]
MKIAVIGSYKIPNKVVEKLQSYGLTPILVDHEEKITSLKGEKRDFVLNFISNSAQKSERVDYVLYLNKPTTILTEHNYAAKGSQCPIVFLLDYSSESPDYITQMALKAALKYSEEKQKVYYLARLMKTASAGYEELYREARKAGVVFIKYQQVEFEELANNCVKLTAWDDYGEICFPQAYLIIAQANLPNNDAETIAKKLRLKVDDQGILSEEKFYLYPVLTNRKGVFVLDFQGDSLEWSRCEQQLEQIWAEICKDINSPSNEEHVLIDAEKCAFCYTCYRVCPHGAMTPDLDKAAMKNLTEACSGCGLCAAFCPANAIKLANGCDKNSIAENCTIFSCKNSAQTALEEAGIKNYVPLACGSELSENIILEALRKTKKVLIAVCVDEACRHFEGKNHAGNVVKNVQAMLKAAGMDENGVALIELSPAMGAGVSKFLKPSI